VNRLKLKYNPQIWKPKLKQKGTKKLPKKSTSCQEEEKQEDEHNLGRFPLKIEVQIQNKTSPDQTTNTPEPAPQPSDILISENTDPNYEPPPPHQGENYSIYARNHLLQDREQGVFHRNYSLMHTEK
jgi:hypothetical protein